MEAVAFGRDVLTRVCPSANHTVASPDKACEQAGGEESSQNNNLASAISDKSAISASHHEDLVESITEQAPSSWPGTDRRREATESARDVASSIRKHRRPSLAERLGTDTSTLYSEQDHDMDRHDSRLDDVMGRVVTRMADEQQLDLEIRPTAFVDHGSHRLARTKEYDQSLFRALCDTFRWRVIAGICLYTSGGGRL